MDSEGLVRWKVHKVGGDPEWLQHTLNECEDREEEVFQIVAVAPEQVWIVTRNRIQEVSF